MNEVFCCRPKAISSWTLAHEIDVVTIRNFEIKTSAVLARAQERERKRESECCVSASGTRKAENEVLLKEYARSLVLWHCLMCFGAHISYRRPTSSWSPLAADIPYILAACYRCFCSERVFQRIHKMRRLRCQIYS